MNGEYEKGEINIIKKALQPGEVVLEIGTGLGFVSAYCSKVTGAENVYTFEANPLNVQAAKEVFQKNDVHPHLQNALLGRGEGTMAFNIDSRSRLASSLALEGQSKVDIKQSDLNEAVRLINPDFLVMDIEGAEFDVFSGIDFHNIRKIQFELHPDILGKEKCDAIFAILERSGFTKDAVSDERNFYYHKY